MDLLAAAGQRLLMQAVAPAPEQEAAAPAAAAAPATAVDGGNGTEGYQVLAACAAAGLLANALRLLCCSAATERGPLPSGCPPRCRRCCCLVTLPTANTVPEPPPPGLLCGFCAQVSFGTSSCTNASGPICYNTAISGENLLTGWVPACLRWRHRGG